MISRRTFLKDGLTAAVCAAGLESLPTLQAQNLVLPLGLQLYSVRTLLPNDYDGTLRHIASLGYREVEAAGFYGRTAAQVKQSMKSAGLHCVSAHYSYHDLAPHLDDVIKYGQELGLQYIICASPGVKNPPPPTPPGARRARPPLTLDDWRWNADQFNRFGEKMKSEGMQFGYHNHTGEFSEVDGVLPMDELLRLTDSSKVIFEMDCGWVVVGGQNPIDYMRRYPNRFSMLHVKDFKPAEPGAGPRPGPTELGRGHIDYAPIFAEAKKIHIRHCFVEQEGFDVPPWESLKIDADYLRKLKY